MTEQTLALNPGYTIGTCVDRIWIGFNCTAVSLLLANVGYYHACMHLILVGPLIVIGAVTPHPPAPLLPKALWATWLYWDVCILTPMMLAGLL